MNMDKGLGISIENIHRDVSFWFTPESLNQTLGPNGSKAGELARQWLARAGKRWRPFLSACVFQSLQQVAPPHESFCKVALAVECFHKASLIHDDIEDDDRLRYGEKTLHEEYGVPIALNVGDLLLGEGYRMIAECDAPVARKVEMFATAARGHCELCEGQGAEQDWMARPGALTVGQVIQIFRQKTSPAFDVALNLAAIYAGADSKTCRALHHFSNALGVSYQICDDIEDFAAGGSDLPAMRPSIMLAIALERGDAVTREAIHAAYIDGKGCSNIELLRGKLLDLGVLAEAETMLEQYKSQAVGALAGLENFQLKALLRGIVSCIFSKSREQVTVCCDEIRAEHS